MLPAFISLFQVTSIITPFIFHTLLQILQRGSIRLFLDCFPDRFQHGVVEGSLVFEGIVGGGGADRVGKDDRDGTRDFAYVFEEHTKWNFPSESRRDKSGLYRTHSESRTRTRLTYFDFGRFMIR